MRLIVDIYKDTGKWYTTLIINNETEIRMYDKDYDDFLKSSFKIPEGGYAVVRDSEENETFHQRLYTSEKLR
ncbi:hypothetical protein B5E87_09630 [Massilimicrobiota sp. An142]|jgi:hypothetical protein|uniref:hypothetical protein n=1 Tax=Massilimicrobiota sp. An142 TaxID=1965564 RepID=UPI000B377861|nr:hypothetical protein [Massilimicrobiota sp. An142]OUQ12525.1 hypothetical protein B5E87_09630 [Massilimicrobiota sp. An142]